MTFVEAYAIINLTLIVGFMIFSVEGKCGTAWEATWPFLAQVSFEYAEQLERAKLAV